MTITIQLQVKEIIFDIQNKTYLTGRSREAGAATNFEAASNMQASDDSENSYQIRRSVSNAFAELKSQLSEFLVETATTTDNLVYEEVDNDGTLNISLEMPSNYNVAATDNLGAAMHQFIVGRSIFDWFTITNKPDADDYAAIAQNSLDCVKRSLYKRVRPTRPVLRTPRPF